MEISNPIERLRRTVSDLQMELLERGSREDLTILRRRLEEAVRERKLSESRLEAEVRRIEEERLRLRRRISELESQIIEMIERAASSGNAAHALREEYEARLALELGRMEAEFRNRLRRAEEEWNGERRRLLGEVRALKAPKTGVA